MAAAVVLIVPATAAGGWALVLSAGIAAALLSIVTATRRERLPRPPRWLVPLAVAALGLAIFWGTPAEVRWRIGDWGPHHVLTRALERSLREGSGIPRWLLGVSSGHAPYDMYPVMTYLVAAWLAVFSGARDDIPAVLFALAVACHVLLCVNLTRLALRMSRRWLAFVVGALSLVDLGGFDSGAAGAILGVGLVHGALAQCFTLTAFIAGLDFLARPRLAGAAVIWVTVALGTACHPSSLTFVLAWMVALLLAAALSPEARPRRVLQLGMHVAIGTLAAAWVWWPLLRRVFDYGLPFAFRSPSLDVTFDELLASLHAPVSSFPIVIGVGALGMLAALASRRLAPTLTGLTAAVLVLSYSDAPHVLLGTAGSAWFTRLQPFRFVTLARPLLFALAAYAVCLAVASLRGRVRPLDRWRRPWAAAVLGLLLLVLLRAAVPFLAARVADVRAAGAAVPDPDGFRALVEWARTRPASGGFERLLYEGDSDSSWIYHLSAETGLPVLFVDDASPCAVGRERMQDASPASLQRFDVRWIASKGAPPTLGDAATELRFGRYYVRAWPGWDGRLARVERGAGEAVVTGLRNDEIDVELRGTSEPALVALGTGYYPRWRARLADGREVPVYAAPSVPGAWSRVPAAWIPPGHVTFTPDGPLPSDGAGRVTAALAIAAALFVAVTPSVRRWHRPLLRAAARAERLLLRRKRSIAGAATILTAVALALWAIRARAAPVAAVELGTGGSGAATVEARMRAEDPWTPCRYSRIAGSFSCGGAGRVGTAAATILSDYGSGNAYLAPAVMAWSGAPSAEFRVRMQRRLEGDYAAATVGRGVAAELRLAGGAPVALTRTRAPLAIAPSAGPVPIEVTFSRPGGGVFGFVVLQPDAMGIDRPPAAPAPPEAAPSFRP